MGWVDLCHACVLFFIFFLITLTRFDLYCCLHIVAWPLHRVNTHPSTHTRSHTHTRSSARPHIPSTRQKFRQSYAFSLSVPLTHKHRAPVGLVWQAAPQKWVEVFCSLSLKLLTPPHPNLQWNIICLRCSEQLRTRRANRRVPPMCCRTLHTHTEHVRQLIKMWFILQETWKEGSFGGAVISPRHENTLITFYVYVKILLEGIRYDERATHRQTTGSKKHLHVVRI